MDYCPINIRSNPLCTLACYVPMQLELPLNFSIKWALSKQNPPPPPPHKNPPPPPPSKDPEASHCRDPNLGPQSRILVITASKNFCIVLCTVCFVSSCVLFVCKCVLYCCHRVATQLHFNKYIISYHTKVILLVSFYMAAWRGISVT